MKEYTRVRRELGKSPEEIAEKMGVTIITYRRIEQGYGNVFEDACIRDHLRLPPIENKRIFMTKP